MHAKYNYLSSTNSTTGICYSPASILSDMVAILSGITDKTQLTGKVMVAGNAYVGITSGSTVVTWAGANTNVNIVVGQGVSGTGIQAGSTVATITDQVGFTLSLNATATSAAVVLTLDDCATLPPSTIGTVAYAVSDTLNGAGAAQPLLIAATAHSLRQGDKVAMSATGYGVTAGTLAPDTGAVYYAEITNAANSFNVSASATATAFTSVTQASPGVFTSPGNTLLPGDALVLYNTGTLPTALALQTPYYVNGSVMFVASVGTNNILTVTSVTVGTLAVGQTVGALGIPAGATIISFGTGTGGAGTYNLSYTSGASVGLRVMTAGFAVGDSFSVCAGTGAGNANVNTTAGTLSGTVLYKKLVGCTVSGNTSSSSYNCYKLGTSGPSLSSGSSVVFWGGSNVQTLQPGMLVSGYGIPANSVVLTIQSNVSVGSGSFTLGNNGNPVNATQTISNNAALVFKPAGATSVPATPVAGVTCDTANTSILTTYTVGGWTLWDGFANAGGPDKVIMRAPLVDDATQFKYMSLSLITTDVDAAGGVALSLMESWNNGTHVATNSGGTLTATYQQRTTPLSAASMFINASARHCLMQSNVTAGIGASGANQWTGVFERTRSTPWDTPSAGYPPAVLVSGVSFQTTTITSSHLRIKNPSGGDVLAATAYLNVPSWNQAITNGPIGTAVVTKVPDGAGGFYTPLLDIRLAAPPVYAFLGGSISTACDVWLGPAYPQNLDETTYSGKTYVFLQNSATSATASSNLAIPKG